MKLDRNLGLVVLAAWLILRSVLAAFNADLPGQVYITSALGVIAGVLLLIRERKVPS